MRNLRNTIAAVLIGLPLAAGTGCTPGELDQLINSLSSAVNETIDNLQSTDILNGPLPRGAADVQGLGIELGNDVGIITNPDRDLRDVDARSVALIGFENETAFDVFIDYQVDGMPQSVYIPAGETTLLRYPCFSGIELFAEWDFDPETGDYVMSYQLGDGPPPPHDDFDDFDDMMFDDMMFDDMMFDDSGDPFDPMGAQGGPDDDFFEEFPDDDFDDFDDFGDPGMGPEFDGQKDVGVIRGTGCGHLIVITISDDIVEETDVVPLDEAGK